MGIITGYTNSTIHNRKQDNFQIWVDCKFYWKKKNIQLGMDYLTCGHLKKKRKEKKIKKVKH